MKKTKSFIAIILLFSILFGLPTLRVSAATHYLNLTSSPTGAIVYINNVRQANITPYTFKTAIQGTPYTITFSRAGYVAQTVKITPTVVASTLSVVLKKSLVLINVTSSPAGATVYINNVKQVSLTPFTFKTAISGALYTIAFSKPGYVPQTVQITAPKVNSSRTVVLKKSLIFINVTSSPSGATVYVDGVKQTSFTPFTFKTAVPGTRYTFTFSKVGYVSQVVQSTAPTTTSNITTILKKVLVLTPPPIYRAPTAATTVFTIGSVGYTLGQQSLTMTAPPYLKNHCIFLPLQAATHALGIPGAAIKYEAATQTFTLSVHATKTVKLSLGSTSLFVNGVLTTMDVVPEITSGLVYFPVSWLAKALGLKTTWDETAQTITLYNSIIRSPTVPALQYPNSTAPENRTFAWTYDGTAYTWQVQSPAALLLYSRAHPSYTPADPLLQESFAVAAAYGNCITWTLEPTNLAYIKQIATNLNSAAKASGYDYFHEAEFILSFVQSAIPYVSRNSQQLPVKTLFDGGVCVDKSILYVSILKALGYKVALLDFPAAYHEVSGVAFTDAQLTQTAVFSANSHFTFYTKNGLNYYFADATSQGSALGELNPIVNKEIPLILPID